MTTVKVDLNKAVKDGLISAKNAKTLEKEYGTSRTTSVFITFLRDLGCALVAAGLLTLLHTLNDALPNWLYSLAVVIYIALAGLLFHKWQKRGNVPQLTSAVGIIIPVAIVVLLKPWLAPDTFDMPATWHIVSACALLAASYIAYRHNHWLTNLSLAGFWGLFISSIVNDFSRTRILSYEELLFCSAVLTIVFAFLWRHYTRRSNANSTFWLHLLAAVYCTMALMPTAFDSFWTFIMGIAMVLLGATLQRSAYGIFGGLVLVWYTIEKLGNYLSGPFAMAVVIIVVGILLLSVSYKTWLQKLQFKRLPSWVKNN